MQTSVFKKSKNSWLQQFFTSLSTSTLLCQPIENTQVSWKNPLKIQSKCPEKMLYPPDMHFSVQAKLTLKFRERLERTRKSIQGVIISQRMGEAFNHFAEFKSSDEEDIGALQQAQGAFCVGVVLSKGQGQGETTRRIRQQLRRCSERSGAIYSQNSKTSQLSEVTKLMLRQIRIFIIIDDSKDTINIGRLMFLPKVNIPLRKVKVQKLSFIQNVVLDMVSSKLNYSKQLTFGYITLNKSQTGYKFLIIDRNDPDLQYPPLIGVWAAGFFKDNKSKHTALWSMIMEYITNPQIKKRLSFQGDNSGLLMVFDSPKNFTQYLFDFPSNCRWGVCAQVENCSKIPEEYSFCQQEVIMEQEREESQVESISSKQDRLKQGYEFQENPPEPISARLIEEKDAEIRRLKVEVEFYKEKAEKLQEELNNLKVLQLASKVYANNPANFPPYRAVPVPQQQPFSFGTNDPPFFGRKSQYKLQECSIPLQTKQFSQTKQFAVKDMKNISFAQDTSFDDDNYNQGSHQRQAEFRFAMPDFKDSKEVKPQLKEVKVFNFKKSEENKDQSNLVVPKNSRIRSVEEKEEIKEKEKQEDKVYSSTNLRSLEEKYGNANGFSKMASNSPKVKEKPVVTEKSNQIVPEREEKPILSLQKKPSREEPIRKSHFQQQSRDKRIKNELYSQQDKSPTKKSVSPLEMPRMKQPQSDQKIQQSKQHRSKSPLPSPSPPLPPKRQPTQRPIISLQSDDDDDELKNIMRNRKTKMSKAT